MLLPLITQKFATRLVVLEGHFDSLSVAIYGQVVGASGGALEAPVIPALSHLSVSYEPTPLPQLPEPRRLPSLMDPARMLAPTQIAVQLLAEDYPDWRLDSVIRQLMSEDDHSAGRTTNGNASLETVSESLQRCVSDQDTDPEDWLDDAAHLSRSPFLAAVPDLADRFVERLHDALG